MDPNPIPDGTPVRVDGPVAISPYCYAGSPLECVIRNLPILGVIKRPERDQTWASPG